MATVKRNEKFKVKTDVEVHAKRGLEFSSYEIELRNRVAQNEVTLRVTDSKIFIEILLSSY